jgi:hypothetical protein
MRRDTIPETQVALFGAATAEPASAKTPDQIAALICHHIASVTGNLRDDRLRLSVGTILFQTAIGSLDRPQRDNYSLELMQLVSDQVHSQVAAAVLSLTADGKARFVKDLQSQLEQSLKAWPMQILTSAKPGELPTA